MHDLPRLGRLIQTDTQIAGSFQGLGEGSYPLLSTEVQFGEAELWGSHSRNVLNTRKGVIMKQGVAAHSWEPSTQQKNCYKF